MVSVTGALVFSALVFTIDYFSIKKKAQLFFSPEVFFFF